MAAITPVHDNNTPVMFEELAELENDFGDVEVEILRKQDALQTALFAKRAALLVQIPNFWALVFEQAPPEIDQYISPSDSEALAALTSLEVTRFEIAFGPASEAANTGDPRSVSFKFEFAENEFFDNTVLEKKFWFRRAKDGWTGLVSEPVNIKWKAGKDLTDGMLQLAVTVWQRQKAQAAAAAAAGTGTGPLPHVAGYDRLVRKVKQQTPGSISFFAWFGFRGRDLSAEESAEATKAEEERREKWKNEGVVVEEPSSEKKKEKMEEKKKDDDEEDESDDEDDDSPPEMEREIFPGGEDLAVSLSEDLFPGAIKYFTEAHEDDNMSEDYVESEEEQETEAVTVDPPVLDDEDLINMANARPAKRKRT